MLRHKGALINLGIRVDKRLCAADTAEWTALRDTRCQATRLQLDSTPTRLLHKLKLYSSICSAWSRHTAQGVVFPMPE